MRVFVVLDEFDDQESGEIQAIFSEWEFADQYVKDFRIDPTLNLVIHQYLLDSETARVP